MNDEPDLRQCAEAYLVPCGSHDFGMPEYGCSCPAGDPRLLIADLLARIDYFEKIDKLLTRIDELRAKPNPIQLNPNAPVSSETMARLRVEFGKNEETP